MSARLSWRRQPSEKGLARVCQGWRGYDLWFGSRRVASVRITYSKAPSYYWYGVGRNSLEDNLTYATPDEAKAAAMKAARDAITTGVIVGAPK